MVEYCWSTNCTGILVLYNWTTGGLYYILLDYLWSKDSTGLLVVYMVAYWTNGGLHLVVYGRLPMVFMVGNWWSKDCTGPLAAYNCTTAGLY